MQHSLEKDFSVFDFNESDEEITSSSLKIMSKLSTLEGRNSARSPLTKYYFLQAFQGGDVPQEEMKDVMHLDIDSSTESLKYKHLEPYTLEMHKGFLSSEDDVMRGRTGNPHEADLEFGEHSFCNSKLGSSLLGKQSDADGLCMVSENTESPRSYSPFFCESYPKENENASWDSSVRSEETLSGSTLLESSVYFFPDYLVYKGKLVIQPQLTFFTDRIKLEGSYLDASDSSFEYEWSIDDLVHVSCQWSEIVNIPCCKLFLRATADSVTKENYGCTGLIRILFAVNDPHWFEKEQKVIELSLQYKSIWNVPFPEAANEVYDVIGQGNVLFYERYFMQFDEPFEDVIYPAGDPDAVSISLNDVKLLEPETFLNDTVIDFYITYLKNRIPHYEKQRMHFFNSFFFRKLADLDKVPSSGAEGRTAFQRIHKWTRKVNLFEKDYIFIPVNFNYHWSLIVICHPGEVAYFQSDNLSLASKVPCILHLDSLKGSHGGLKNLIQSYLFEEWRQRYGETCREVLFKFSSLRFVSMELPQQENCYDCGLFLLHYVECFLDEAPNAINPFHITEFSNFLSKDWFPPAEASHKRFKIRRLMYDILHGRGPVSPKASSFSSEDVKDNVERNLSGPPADGQNTDKGFQAASLTLPAQDISRATGSLKCFMQMEPSHDAGSVAEEDTGKSMCTSSSGSSRESCEVVGRTRMQTCGMIVSPREVGEVIAPVLQDSLFRLSESSSVFCSGGADMTTGICQPEDVANGTLGILELRPTPAAIPSNSNSSLMSSSFEGLQTCMVRDSEGSDPLETGSISCNKRTYFTAACCQNFAGSSYQECNLLHDCATSNPDPLDENDADELMRGCRKRRIDHVGGDKRQTRASKC